ncbi:DEKNAAC101130 [Brettanomyces naardenensis]|uniref:DEKNAAC101130 n=1 Tax=Brettanomyces naardenensis TaxID=13370 RepID=A0A448YH50_BRENA|nr:DEKNAAC101130 [Brettanomyces naardenensis]
MPSLVQPEEPSVGTSTVRNSYTVRLDNADPNLDELVLRFQEKCNVDDNACELVRTTDGENDVCYVKFFHDEENMNHFIDFLKDEEGTEGQTLKVINSEEELSLRLPGNLYIRGLLPSTRSEDLFNIFHPYGEIQSCKIIYDDYGYSKGYGFINFANKAQADLAIEHLNGCNVDGNNLFINHHVSKKDRFKELELKKQNYSNLYVKNIPPDLPKEELYDLFGKYGVIESVFLPRSEDDTENKGYGFINFKFHDDALKAQEEMNDYVLRPGYKIQISRAERKKDRFQFQNLNSHFSVNYTPLSPSHSSSSSISTHESFSSLGYQAVSTPPETATAASPLTEAQQIKTPSLPESNKDSNSFTAPPQFVVAADSNLISTGSGLPIAGPEFQDSNLYITHLPLDFTDADLEDLFTEFGPIVSAKVITYQRNKKTGLADLQIGSRDARGKDPESLVGKSKGFGFVCFQKPVYASKALVAMNHHRVDSTHVLNVSFAQRKENKFERGRLHHYNQNNLGGFYRYLNFHAQPGYAVGPPGVVAQGPASSVPGSPVAGAGFYPLPPPQGSPYYGNLAVPVTMGDDGQRDRDDQEEQDEEANDDENHQGNATGAPNVPQFAPQFLPYGGYYYYPYVPYDMASQMAPPYQQRPPKRNERPAGEGS